VQQQIVEKVLAQKIVAIIRGVNGKYGLKLAETLHQAGISIMEVTFDLKRPETHAETCQMISEIRTAYAGQITIGAGTVTQLSLLEQAADAGAQFIVSPNTDPAVIARTKALQLVSMPGAFSPSEIVQAHDAGADFVKLFPASTLGISYVKSVLAPLSHIRLIAVGGIHEKNAADFLAAGCVGLGIGGNLADVNLIKAGKFAEIAQLAQTYRAIVKG